MPYKYYLQASDYIYLYPLYSPAEIAEEFGTRSSTARSIQRVYKKCGFAPQRDCLRDIIKRSYVLADVEVNQKIWGEYVYEEIAKERLLRKKVLWNRIRQFEEGSV